MLLERLHEPCSKRSNYFHQQEFLGIKPVELHQLYRCLDYLAEHQERIQQSIYHTGRDLFSGQLDVVFYDVTTFYFDSDKEQEGALRQKGFSKDGKIGNTQILFGMLIDKNKQPIGYKVYKGDSYEGNTFKEALEQLKKQYQIKDVIVVADRGMLSKTNIAETLEKGYDFILGERLRTLPDAVKAYLTNREHYTKTWVYTHQQEAITLQYATLEYEGRTIICTYSQKRADKDAKEREAKLETAQILLKQPNLLKKKAQHYFLKEAKNATFELNEAKIEDSKRFDGFLAIATNAKQISIEQALDHYRHLFQIEHSFRTYKSHLETRPMFHWTDKRIEGHMCLCYIAYTMLTYVQNKLKAANHTLSENQIKASLDSMQVSLVKNKGDHFYLRSAQNSSMEVLSTFLGLRKLPNVVPQSEIINYL
jgi:transposase